MSIQNIKKALFIGAALFSFNANAQIEKGATSLGGNAYYDNEKSNLSSGTYQQKYFNLTPSYGRFITDKIMVKGKLNAQYLNYASDFSIFLNSNKINTYNSKNQSLSIEAETRYYFNPTAKWKFFGGILLGGSIRKGEYSTFTNGNISSKSEGKSDNFNYSAFCGVNRFINKEIVLEATLGYSTINNRIPRGYGYFYNRPNWGLNVGFNHFTQFKTTEKDFEGLISKGRSIINGNLVLNTRSQKTTLNNIETRFRTSFATLDLEYGQFVAKGLLTGAKASFIFQERFQDYSIAPYVQYFSAVTKRLMLHSKFELQGSIDQNNNTHLTFRGALGATYFLSKNVALSADVLSFSKTSGKSANSSSEWEIKNLNSNIGLRFFLK